MEQLTSLGMSTGEADFWAGQRSWQMGGTPPQGNPPNPGPLGPKYPQNPPGGTPATEDAEPEDGGGLLGGDPTLAAEFAAEYEEIAETN